MISPGIRTLLCSSMIVVAFGLNVIAQQPVAADAAKQAQEELAKKIRQELSFLKCVVELNPEQDQRLSKFDVSKIEDIRIQQRKVAPGVDFGGGQIRIVGRGAAPVVDPLKMRQIERAFEKETAAVLNAEQQGAYSSEKKLRDDFYKETAVRGILIILDKRLSLSKTQRDAIYSSLYEWGGITSFDMTPYESSNLYLPAIPDSVLVKHLNESQRAILSSTSRMDFGNRMQIEQNLQLDFDIQIR